MLFGTKLSVLLCAAAAATVQGSPTAARPSSSAVTTSKTSTTTKATASPTVTNYLNMPCLGGWQKFQLNYPGSLWAGNLGFELYGNGHTALELDLDNLSLTLNKAKTKPLPKSIAALPKVTFRNPSFETSDKRPIGASSWSRGTGNAVAVKSSTAKAGSHVMHFPVANNTNNNIVQLSAVLDNVNPWGAYQFHCYARVTKIVKGNDYVPRLYSTAKAVNKPSFAVAWPLSDNRFKTASDKWTKVGGLIDFSYARAGQVQITFEAMGRDHFVACDNKECTKRAAFDLDLDACEIQEVASKVWT